mgnify:CR=1 FL=1|jgi:hypothetical protein
MTAPRLDLRVAQRAEATLQRVLDANNQRIPPEVLTRLRGLAVMLRTLGVPATLAFFAGKADRGKPLGRAYQAVLDALLTELAHDGPALQVKDLFTRLERMPAPELMLAFARLNAYAGWLRRLAEAWQHDMGGARG